MWKSYDIWSDFNRTYYLLRHLQIKWFQKQQTCISRHANQVLGLVYMYAVPHVLFRVGFLGKFWRRRRLRRSRFLCRFIAYGIILVVIYNSNLVTVYIYVFILVYLEVCMYLWCTSIYPEILFYTLLWCWMNYCIYTFANRLGHQSHSCNMYNQIVWCKILIYLLHTHSSFYTHANIPTFVTHLWRCIHILLRGSFAQALGRNCRFLQPKGGSWTSGCVSSWCLQWSSKMADLVLGHPCLINIKLESLLTTKKPQFLRLSARNIWTVLFSKNWLKKQKYLNSTVQ